MGKLATSVVLLAALAVGCYSRSVRDEDCDIQYYCPDESYQPVCGNDSVTYDNDCYMAILTCSRVEVLYPGPCIGPDTPPACRQIPACNSRYQPVCGSNGITYDNDCYFRAQTCGTDITLRHSGECPEPTPPPYCNPNRACPLLLSPVCGSDGVTYDNDCFFEAQTCGTDITLRHNGECEATTIPPNCNPNRACPLIHLPVCGSDGFTYDNNCTFEAQTCGRGITIRHSGECPETTPSPPCDQPRACDSLYLPVCGSDGVTYTNDCFFEAQTCGQWIGMAHRGECRTNSTSGV